jgi:hypothetical protein
MLQLASSCLLEYYANRRKAQVELSLSNPHRRRRDMVPLILNLGTRWRCVVNFTPRPLYPREKNSIYCTYRRLFEPQNWSGYFEEKKILLTLPGIESLTDQAVD